ncbi:glycosyltransferase family 2 protein [Oceaniglobus indicus]|uniref:glycosyltransferase family 2 protein n=1 Tax=Oceaniglobus indicus TaxID=2047749 RepID=UPI000C179577|nr:glycosyltransferase family 2 protein [Oceaniglobus indicus]
MQNDQRRTFGDRVRAKLDRVWHAARLRAGLSHVSGPRRPTLRADDVVVVALVRDGAYYLDPWLAHYRAIGARHFVFIDNGSGDGTRALLARNDDCTVMRADLPWGAFENGLRETVARRFATGHWVLFADMDELFDLPPGFDHLSALAHSLRAEGQSALIAQMLEMFPAAPLGTTKDLPFDAVLTAFDRYDISTVKRFAYHDPAIGFAWYLAHNTLANPDIPVMFGGVRARVFGEDCCLTKHPLVFLDHRARPGVHPHAAAHVACAPFTALIRHYKFAGDPFGRDRALAARGVIFHGEDRKRLAVAEAGDVTLDGPEAQTFTGQADLYRQGFLQGPAHLPDAPAQ